MDPEIERLAQKIVKAYRSTPRSGRLLIAIAGAPGSGKSTLAYPLTAHINAMLRNQPEDHFVTHGDTGLTFPAGVSDAESRHNTEVAVCVGLDGWHYSRIELDGFKDPAEAHWRRGAAFTFNLPSYLTFLQQLRIPLTPDPAPMGIPFPTFDHALKDPTPSPFPILPQHRIVVIEGLYTMLDRAGWRDCAEMMDMRIWVETDREICRRRLIKRNWEAGIVADLKACEERVDASDMMNGEEVRQNQYQPTDTVAPSDVPHSHEGSQA